MRTRIAPSPTGYLHVGTLRTVLWDVFMARQAGGQFIVRIEDTDQERFVPGSVEALLRALTRMGIAWDEGPVLQEDGTLGEKGPYGPYTQTHRLHIYAEYAQQLLAGGHAYHCFCSPARLEEMRAAQTALKQTPKYDRACTRLSADEVVARISAGEKPCVRMKIPEGTVSFTDAIRGTISFDLRDVDDQVIVKSNGIPTYHLAVVVDDYLMKITHVLRGEEWLSSTPKQIVLHNMLNIPMPVYAHVPLTLNPDKTKLSKRKGDVSVEQFLEKGYLPEALNNFMATMGFNPSADREIFTQDELIQAFDLARVNHSGAVMNLEKLDWMNKQYLHAMGDDAYIAYAAQFTTLDTGNPAIRRALLVEKQRISRLTELATLQEQYFTTQEVTKATLLGKKGSEESVVSALTQCKAFLLSADGAMFASVARIESTVKAFIAEHELNTGLVLWPLRTALSGREQSPSPFEYLYVLQRDEAIARIDRALHVMM